MNIAKKLNAWLPLLFALVMVVGMSIGFKLRENTVNQSGFFKVPRSSTLQEVTDLIRTRYVDSINTDTLAEEAIGNLLKQLDPHSAYIPAVNLQQVTEDLQGNFGGIGVEFNIFSDTVHILHVTELGPGEKAGLQVGDQIIKVEDSLVAGNGITSAHIRKLLRGAVGTRVRVTVLRGGSPVKVIIERGLIAVPSVDAAYLITSQTGYIHINKFSETTHREFAEQLEQLQKKGLQQLIIDLRDNGGGILQEAVDIADELLDGDKLIVYTQGDKQKRQDYRCKKPGLFEKGKLVVLANEGSASASEILMGALQDWDRATIIGRRSFGKGLVQEQYDLADGSAMRLTIARYYTPSGRCIQKPYDKGAEDYRDDISTRYQNGEILHADSNHVKKGQAYKTASGKTVYGGGGIMPDVFVSGDTSTSSFNLRHLFATSTMSKFAYRYYMQHKKEIVTIGKVTDFYYSLQKNNLLWNEFASFAGKDSLAVNDLSAKEIAFVQKRLIALMARQQWRSNGSFAVLNTEDSTVMKALELLR